MPTSSIFSGNNVLS